MHIQKMIQSIVNNGKQEDMEELSEILEELMYKLQEYDEKDYKKYEMSLYCMAYGNVLSEEMAEEIVHKMKPYGMRWSEEETKRMQDDYGLNDIRETDFFVVINSAYNDYNDIFGDDIETYIKFTIDFINDEDAKEGKVFKYFTILPK